MSALRMTALSAAAVAALASACTAGVPQARTSVTSSPAETSSTTPVSGRPKVPLTLPTPWADVQPPTSCPVTLGTPGAVPPSSIGDQTLEPVEWVDKWYGADALWTRLPPTGVLPALGEAGNLSTKFPWWRGISAPLTFQARRLDGPSAGFSGDYPSYGYDLGFLPSALHWPDTGCWQVTATLSGHSLTFTLWVQRFPEYR